MANRADNFNRSDTTNAIGTPSDAGSAWSQLFGTFGIASNQGYESAGTGQAMAVLESSEADGEVSVKLSVLPDAGKAAGVVCRVSTFAVGFYFEYLNDFGGFLRFYRMDFPTFTQLGQLNTSISAGDVLSVEMSGNSLTPKVNGSAPGLSGGPTYTDSHNSTATKHGLWADVAGAGRFDDFAFTGGGPAPATTYTFTGPSSGTVNEASTDFTVTPDGDADGIEVTPASDGAGSFTPSSVTFTGSGAETFTYTPTSTTGSPHTLSVTNDGALTDPDDLEYTVNAATDVIACTDQTAGRIYQRAAGTAARTVTFAGTYTGTEPATVEVQIQDHTSGSTIQDWTALGGTAIGGGNWSGTLSVPEAANWYKFRARGKDGGGSVLATSSVTSNKWGVGILVAMLGQSNMQNMTLTSSTPPASSDLTRRYNGSWAVVGGNGSIRFANTLQAGAGLLTGILDYGQATTAITQWNSGGSGEVLDGFLTGLADSGGDVEFVLWHQGESDAIAGTSKATYKTALDTLYADLQTATGRDSTELRFGCALVGTMEDDDVTDATADAIRQAQLEWVAETAGAFHAGSSVDIARIDDFHWAAAGYERMGRRYAQAILEQLGEEAFGAGGPLVASARRYAGDATVFLTCTQDGGAFDGTGADLTGFEVSDDDFSTTLTITGTGFLAGQVLLALSAAPGDGDTVKVRYQYGENPDITEPAYDDTAPGGDTLGLPLRPTVGSLTATLLSAGGGGGGVFGGAVIR